MNRTESLMIKIEEERNKLNKMVEENNLEASYHQSLVLDGLIEEYISLTNVTA